MVVDGLTQKTFSYGSLTRKDADYYGRQLVLPEISLEGQTLLKNSKVVVIGAGGIGSTACLYLAGAGIGCLRIVDNDTVSIENLHRQIIHDSTKLGRSKAESAQEECLKRNSLINVEMIKEKFTSYNAERIVSDVDVVLDATDNAFTRYAISDACVSYKKPLVFGSALGWDGQVSVFNLRKNTAPIHAPASLLSLLDLSCPCFRCIFPNQPRENNSNACEIQGVVGPAPGLVGTFQAIETIKICLHHFDSVLKNVLLLINLFQTPQRIVQCVQLPPAQKNCSCLSHVNQKSQHLMQESCVMTPLLTTTLEPKLFISAKEFFKLITATNKNGILTEQTHLPHNIIILDVRPTTHYSLVSIIGSVSFPAASLLRRLNQLLATTNSNKNSKTVLKQLFETVSIKTTKNDVYCLCRRGKDASRVTARLLNLINTQNETVFSWKVVSGGLFGLRDTVPELKDLPLV